MDYNKQLTIERYRIVTRRQEFFAQLRRDAIGVFLKIMTAILGGHLALGKLVKYPDVWRGRLRLLVILVAFVTLYQILQLEAKILRLREVEHDINVEAPEPKAVNHWAWFLGHAALIVVITAGMATL